MAHFNDIKKQKMLLREALLKNQAVVNLLVNTGNNVMKFEDVKTGSGSPAASLVKMHFYVPGTSVMGDNFISMRGRVIYTDTNVVKETRLVVYVICSENNIDLLQGSRADLLANEIDMILNNGADPLFGYGGIRLGDAEEVQFAQGYSGWEIPYETHEMNRKVELL